MNRFMELINKMIDDVAQNIFTTLILRFAYHQIPISHTDRKYTTFEVSGKLYQFIRLHFGITNGVSAFQRCMNNIIEKENLIDTVVYVDNMCHNMWKGSKSVRLKSPKILC